MNPSVVSFLVASGLLFTLESVRAETEPYELNDSHCHLTNYIQQGINIHEFITIMRNRVGCVAIFGIPLQQQWSYRVDGDHAPPYDLNSDAPLYYYSFTDAWIAMAYKALTHNQRARLDRMITGFNPSDMYAVDHIRRVLQTFPGVFTFIGEVSIHKEFVSAKRSGEFASLQDPAVDRIFDFADEVGLVALIHNDMDVPFAQEGSEPAYLSQTRALFKRHPKTTIIWAHPGMGGVVRPIKNHATHVAEILADPEFRHV